MQRKIVYFLLIAFVVYLITLDPSEAGSNANNFVGWLGGGLETAQEFLDELVGDNSAEPRPATPTEVPTPLPVATATPTPAAGP